MGVIGGLRLLVDGILSAVLSRQLTDELKAWMPWIIEQIVRRAVSRLPRGQQERLGEEWRSHLNEVPGEIGRVVVALGFIVASRRISSMLRTGRGRVPVGDIFKRSVDLVVSLSILVWVAPVMGLISLLLRLEGSPVLSRTECVGLRGCSFMLLHFCTASRMGKFLRTIGWHALPELVNVYRGEMSFFRRHPPRLKKRGRDR
jgi:hypothetical protein